MQITLNYFLRCLLFPLPWTLHALPGLPSRDGMWASCIRVLDPINGETVQQFNLEQNEAALSICLARFTSMPDAIYCVVGVAKNYRLSPRSSEGGFLYTYRLHRSTTNQVLNSQNSVIEEIHTVQMERFGRYFSRFGHNFS